MSDDKVWFEPGEVEEDEAQMFAECEPLDSAIDRKKERCRHNTQMSMEYLEKHDIPFVVKNNGAHLIVEGDDCFIDFWPGTGRWIKRTGEKGFGVRNLVRDINQITIMGGL